MASPRNNGMVRGFKLPYPQRGPRKVKTSIARLVSKAGVPRSRKGVGLSLRLSTLPLDHRTPRQLLASACRHRARREGRAVSRCATLACGTVLAAAVRGPPSGVDRSATLTISTRSHRVARDGASGTKGRHRDFSGTCTPPRRTQVRRSGPPSPYASAHGI